MKVNTPRIKTHIDELSAFTATPGKGVTRLTYSQEDKQAREYIKAKMSDYGLQVSEDGIGNIFGKLQAENNDAPSVIVGSHFDSVPHGGAYDGTAGVVVGLEVAALFQEEQIKPTVPLEIIAMVEEEGTRFGGGLMGSRSIVGDITDEELDTVQDKDGISLRTAMEANKLNPDVPRKRAGETIKAFLEMHIEQGPILEDKNIPIGIVQSITGITQLEISVKGQAGHAGTTPMNQRADALLPASEIISKLPALASEIGKGMVITTGSLQVYPNGANVIPGEVVFTVDIRSDEEYDILQAIENVKELVYSFNRNKIDTKIEQKTYIPPKALNPSIRELLRTQSEKLQIPYDTINSGAGHDAMVLSDITDTGMVFIPSKNGLSHCPEEWSSAEDIAFSAAILFEASKTLTLE
ncbi:MAG TPA: Zn-dependent hydrolase [Pseudogracilibacillus sp.]|nr:Zn-dependent hydrolase [Pseudogracilibacillus sp.]